MMDAEALVSSSYSLAVSWQIWANCCSGGDRRKKRPLGSYKPASVTWV